MPHTYYSRSLLLFLFFILSGAIPLFSQEKNAKVGMTPLAKNVTSFPVISMKNTEEWKKHNNPDDYTHPDFGKLPGNAPCENCVEVLEKRTVDERYFVGLDNPGEFFVQKALGDLHQLVNGEWITINHELRPVSGSRYESGYLLDQPVIDFSAARTELKTSNGTLRFNNWKLIVVQHGTESNQFVANWSDYTVGSDGAFIHNVFPGIDAEMIVFRGAIKTNFIINSNQFGVFEELIFREELEHSIHARFSEGSHTRGIGSLKLMAGSTELAVMDEAKLFAQNGPKELGRSGEYRIHSNTIDLLVDYDWINSNIGLYRLVVDPLVTGTATLAQGSITGSRYNASCNFTNSCDYNLSVPFPANATVTGVNFTFTYNANGTACWLEDGAVRIASGGCVSPSATGYYWFCNGIGGGTCSATNQTVYTDLATCMPAPSCAVQNVPFTLQFFRSCWGSSGCSNTCIGAASPWVMNMTGKTLEYNNATTPITLAATTVCQGGSINASTLGTGGVPGYTYNWSFSPTGTPSVGTGASASISFPNSGTVTLYSIVTDACGNQVTSNRNVTVTPGTVPTVTASGPTTFCTGGSVTLTSSAATGNTWSTGATTQSITVTASGSYTVTVGGGGACSATSVATVVTVTPIPATPTITASGPTTFCEGGSVTLTSSAASGNTWSTGATTPTITVTTSGTYTLSVAENGCTSPTASVTVTVNPLPQTPTISVGGPTTFCEGGSVTLTSSATTGNTWSTGATTQSITVTASGSYTVTVGSGGCTATSVATVVTVNPIPATPTITANGPTTFCEGGSVVLTSSAATGNTWSTGATTSTITVNASGTYSVTVSSNGCTATSAATTVTANLLPAVPTIAANGPTTICAGETVVLTSSSATGNTWSTGETTQSITVTASGTYSVTVSNGSCTSAAAAEVVTVNPLPPVPTISANGPTTFCEGGSVTLTSSSTTGNTWWAGANGQSVTVSTGGSYSVTTTVSGCSSTSAPVTVTVIPLPTISASNNGPLCVNEPLHLTATGSTGGNYSWTGPNSFTSTLQNPTIASVTNADFGVYTVTITDNSCTATATTTVVVNTGTSTAINTSGPFCENNTAVMLSAVNPGGIWSGTGIVNASTGLFDPGISGPGSFVITYDIPGSCSGASSTTIVVNPAPVVDFVANNLTGCAPLPVSFTNQTPTAGTATWNFGNGESSTSLLNASSTYTSSGCFPVTLSVTDINGCTATLTKADLICIHPAPNASFTPSPFDATITHSEVHFINTSTNATGYFWTFGDGGNSAAVSPTHQYDEVASNYIVQLVATDDFGCSDTAKVVVRVLDELIYYVPNSFTPNGDEHNNIFQPVFTSGFDAQNFTLLIFNKWGEVIFESKDPAIGWDGTYNGVLVNEGQYIWTVAFKDPNTDKKYTANGHVNLLK